MKRIRFIAVLVLLMSFSFACEKEDPVPQCEQNKVGSVLVENDTGYTGEFDVTWGDVSENYEKTLYDGNTHLYNNIPASGHPESYGGTIELWIRLKVGSNWTDWVYNEENLSPCEEMEYRWYLSNSKSSELKPILEISSNGVVIKTITEFQTGGKKANK